MDTKFIITLAEAYAGHLNLKLSSVSTYAVNDGKRLDHIKAGGGCTMKTAGRFAQWFSDHWPADLEWPADIPRPAKFKKEAA